MNKSKENISRLIRVSENDIWDSFVNQSEQFNVFVTSSYLESVGLSSNRYVLYVNGVPKLAYVHLPTDYEKIAPQTFSTYQSILFLTPSIRNYSDDNIAIDLMQKFLNEYRLFDCESFFSLHHSYLDLRGLQWYYYNDADSEIRITPRYTGLINICEFPSFESYLKTIRNTKRNEWHKFSRKRNVFVEESLEIDEFIALYKMTFSRQGMVPSREILTRVANIIEAGISNGYGKLYLLRSMGGDLISGAYICTDGKTDYYQFGANNPNLYSIGGSSILLLNAIRESFKHNKATFDLVGMNSPKRGDFKASFNARPKLYFEFKV